LQYYAEALLGSHHQVKLNYFSGWKNNLIDQLDIEIEKDRRFKRTHSGPHRADLQIIFNDETAKNSASRGQQKLLVVIFTLSQIALHQQQSQSPGLLMIDDLPSELDAQHQNLVINALFDLKQQILITAIDPDSLDLSLWTDSRMFHVKHGRFSEVV
jgi:DNA replication and repair protein RecF